ncbi:MAG TPA: DUF2510 domain-containing protein [Thermoleophilaceae bacterium]
MSNPRGNIGHILTAAGGALLALFTFMAWFDPGELSAWEIFNIVDVVIFFAALGAAALAVAHLVGMAANLPPQVTSAQRWLGAVAALFAIAFIVEIVAGDGEFKFGGFLAILAALVLLAGTVLLVRPDLAATVNEATANIGSGGGAGAPGAGAHQPGGMPAPGGGLGGPPSPGGTPGGGLGGPPSPGGGPGGAPSPGDAPAPGPSSPAPSSPAPVSSPTPASQPDPSAPAAGWYPDPQGQKRLRYWDGGRWTEQTAD